MNNIRYAYVSWPDAQKVPISSPLWSIFMPRTLTNSSYRLKTTDHRLTQYQPQTLKMKSYQNLSCLCQTWWVWSMFMLRHKASPHNFKIQFPMYSKLITNACNVTLNTSMHQYFVISKVPPTGHRHSDIHHPIYMTFIGVFLHIIQHKMT